jgi:hypothetical protein
MDNLLYIILRAARPEFGHDRGYQIKLGIDLFNQWFVTVSFGRYKTLGTNQTKYFNTRKEAYQFIDRSLKRRLSSPRRIGCPYQMVALNGRRDILDSINTKVIERFSWFKSFQSNHTPHPLRKLGLTKGYKTNFVPNHPLLFPCEHKHAA